MSMVTVGATQLRDRIGEMLNRVLYGKDRVVIERRGKPVAVIISIEDFRYFEKLDEAREIELFRMAKALASEPLSPSELDKLNEALHGDKQDLTEELELNNHVQAHVLAQSAS